MRNTVVLDMGNKMKHNTAPGLGAVAAWPLAENCCAQNMVHTIVTESINRRQLYNAMALVGLMLLACSAFSCMSRFLSPVGTSRRPFWSLASFTCPTTVRSVSWFLEAFLLAMKSKSLCCFFIFLGSLFLRVEPGPSAVGVTL